MDLDYRQKKDTHRHTHALVASVPSNLGFETVCVSRLKPNSLASLLTQPTL